VRKEARLEHQRDQGCDQELDDGKENQDAREFSDVERGPIHGGHHQRPQRFALPFALERPAERERSRECDRDPQNPCRGLAQRRAFLDEPEREDQHARDREEQRRVDDLAAADLDHQIFARNQPGGVKKCQHCFQTTPQPGPPRYWSVGNDL
jgi:hypothetical protein